MAKKKAAKKKVSPKKKATGKKKAAAKKAAKPSTGGKTKTPKKKATPKKKVGPSTKGLSDEEIRKAAYLNYKARVAKGEHGDEAGDWLDAERRIKKGD